MKNILTIIIALGAMAFSKHPHNNKFTPDETFVGTWSLVSVENIYPDGKRAYPYGLNPEGLLVFDDKGNYSIQIFDPKRPKIASGDKSTATEEECKSLVEGVNAHFGKYEADTQAMTLSFKITGASFPNWEGTTQLRSYSLRYDQLKYVVKNTTQGGKSVYAQVLWKKIR